MSFYNLSTTTLDGEAYSFEQLKGKVVLIVNVASKCGFTPQYKGLQQLHDTYKDQGLVVLGFPCDQFGHQEPGGAPEIKQTCQQNYGVKFQIMQKIDVNGENRDPVYKYLMTAHKGAFGAEDIKWNFAKFLVDRNGEIVNRFAPTTTPEEMEKEIQELLK